jgi:hypothetical protein
MLKEENRELIMATDLRIMKNLRLLLCIRRNNFSGDIANFIK